MPNPKKYRYPNLDPVPSIVYVNQNHALALFARLNTRQRDQAIPTHEGANQLTAQIMNRTAEPPTRPDPFTVTKPRPGERPPLRIDPIRRPAPTVRPIRRELPDRPDEPSTPDRRN